MNITFLVGNGFDLSLGYKTSYQDFYDWYLTQPTSGEHASAISMLKDDIKQNDKNREKNWADFEIGLGTFSKSFGADDADEFVASYEDAIKHLQGYLAQLHSKNDIENISEKQWEELRRNLCYFFQECNEAENDFFNNLKGDEQNHGWESSFQFVSFNYTDFLDKFITKMNQKPLETWQYGSAEKKHKINTKVFHIHGTLGEYPTIGVSNKEQILNTEFRKNDLVCTALIKSKAIGEFGSKRYSHMQEIIKNSRIICIWGMSLGTSDMHWWQCIIDWLKVEQNRSIFIFEFTNNPPDPISVPDLYRKKRTVVKKLLRHSNITGEEFDKLLSRCHVIFNTEKVLTFGKILGVKLESSCKNSTLEESVLLEYLASHPQANRKEIADSIGMSQRVATVLLKALREKGLLVRTNNKRNGVWEVLSGDGKNPDGKLKTHKGTADV